MAFWNRKLKREASPSVTHVVNNYGPPGVFAGHNVVDTPAEPATIIDDEPSWREDCAPESTSADSYNSETYTHHDTSDYSSSDSSSSYDSGSSDSGGGDSGGGSCD